MKQHRDFTILVVDDDPDMRDITETVLIKENYKVVTAGDGQACFQAIEQFNPDLILLDIVLPDLSGLEICHKIKNDPKRSFIHIILLSGEQTSSDQIAQGLESGADEYLIKPVRSRELKVRVEAACRRIEIDSMRLALLKSEAKFRNIFEHSNISKSMTAIDGAITVNQAFCDLIGYSKEELLNKTFQELTHPDDVAHDQQVVNDILAGKYSSHRWEKRYIHKNGRVIWADVSTILEKDDDNNPRYFITSILDFTRRKQMEELLETTSQNFRSLFDYIAEGVALHELVYNSLGIAENYRILDVNPAFQKHTGISPAMAIGKLGTEVYGVTAPPYLDTYRDVAETGEPATFDVFFDPFNKHYTISVSSPQRGRFVTIFQDITGRKQAEIRLSILNRTYALLSAINQTMIKVHDPQALFEDVCKIAVKLGGFRMAWIGILDPETRIVKPVAEAGLTGDYLKTLRINIDDDEVGRGPTAMAIHTGEHQVSNDISGDPKMSPWRDQALTQGYQASAVFPFRIAGEMKGTMNLYANEANFFDERELKLLDELAANIAFAMEFADEEKQRRATEEALIDSERLLRESQEVGKMGSYCWDLSKGLWSSSKIMDTIFGIDENYVRSFEGWTALIHPDWQVVMTDYVAHEILGKHNVFDKEYKIIRQNNGEEAWVHGLGVLELNPDGSPKRLIGTISDITVRKEAEKRSTQLSRGIEQSPAAIIFTDPEGKIEYVNPKFVEMTGYAAENITGKTARILNRKKNPGTLTEQIWETVLTGREWKGEYLSKRLSGETYWESVSVSPIFDNEGILLNYILIVEDISGQKKMIAELVEAKEKAEQSDRLKSTFLANMSHEIRTPMNAITGFAGMLSDPDLSDGERHQFTEIIQSRSDDLMHLINDLLDISRIESGNATAVKEQLNLNGILDEMEMVFQQKLRRSQKKGILLVVEKSLPDKHASIYSDGFILRQVFSNLIDNAIKFTESGIIRFGYEVPENGWVTCFVSDPGIGISPENQTVIFEHFRQAEMPDPHRYGGTGLGLSICKGSLALLGGDIRVESEQGKGSTFFFRLPHENPSDGESVRSQQAIVSKVQNSPTAPQSNDWSGKTILLVEDDITNMEYLQVILGRTQAQLVKAYSGSEVKALFGTLDSFDLVLLDVRLPDASGWDLAAEMKKIRPDLPIIAQTAYAMSTDKQKSIEAGCDRYISKPINKLSLLVMIDTLIKR